MTEPPTLVDGAFALQGDIVEDGGVYRQTWVINDSNVTS